MKFTMNDNMTLKCDKMTGRAINLALPFSWHWICTIRSVMRNLLFDTWFTSTPSFDFVQDVRTEEKEDEYVVKMEATGIDKDEIKITVEGKSIVVKGESDWKKINYRIQLPQITDEITAKTKNGVLEITVKKAKKDEPKYIQVQ